jgi:transcriptional regulator with XRE-family HTH domain
MSEFQEKLRCEFQDKEYAHAYMEESLNHYIATQIKVLREQRQLTQTQLAILAEMEQGDISVLEDVDYESWSIKSLKQLANAFDVTLHVSFESFSNSIQRIENFSRKILERPSRIQDLMQQPTVEAALINVEEVLYKLQTIKHTEISGTTASAIDTAVTLTPSSGNDLNKNDMKYSLFGQYSNPVNPDISHRGYQ